MTQAPTQQLYGPVSDDMILVEDLLESTKQVELIPLKRMLDHALEARGKVLLKVNVAAANKDAVLAALPAAKSPTVNQLANGGFAIETVVEKAGINLLIPELRDAGATDMLEIPIVKIIP